MSDLAIMQREMSAALRDTTGDVPNGLTGRCRNPSARFDIYRNTTQISLREALSANFPVTTALVDRRFFDFLADRYIRQHPPREPRLARFGSSLPSFITAFEPCKDHPYLADVARLEWAMVEASCIAVEQTVPHSVLNALKGGTTQARLHLQPSLRYIVARWPVIDLWLMHQADRPESLVKLDRRPRFIEVRRRGRGVEFATLEPSRFLFRYKLAQGGTLEQAALRALRRDRFFDLVSELIALFREDLVTRLEIVIPTDGDRT